MAEQNTKTNISLAKVGMEKDTHPSQLNETQYTHAFNANVETETGNNLNITNEKSNLLMTRFKPGFVLVGFENDILSNHTYVMLLNPTTGVGEFGYIEDNQNVVNLEDIAVICGNGCDEIRELNKPLEEIVQSELLPNSYHTLISDEYALDNSVTPPVCYHYTDQEYKDKKLGFNFSTQYPIKKSVIKNEKTGKNIYFTDNNNPPRHINITNVADYYIQNIPCQPDYPTTCIDFDELRIFKLFKIPKIEASSIELGGRLKMGAYEFLVAYSDAAGNEISPYYSITQPIAIFDRNNRVLAQPELADRTNYAIKLEVTGLDKRYTHYKVAVVQTADIEGATRYFIEGLHTINDTTVLYTTEQNKIATSIDKINIDRLHVEKSEGMTASNNILFQYGIELKKELNLQPVVNFLGQFLKWQTSIAKEDLYEDGVLGYQTRGYNRDEVVPFSIRFLLDGGYETAIYPFISRVPEKQDPLNPSKAFDFEVVVSGGQSIDPENSDIKSILENKTSCGSSQRVYRWQYYNTAKEEPGYCLTSGEIETETVQEEVIRVCEIPVEDVIPSDTISINLDDTFTNLEDYINDHIADCETDPTFLTGNSGTSICEYLTNDYPELGCNTAELTEGLNVINLSEPDCIVKVDSILNEQVTNIPKVFPTEYNRFVAPTNCIIYKIDYSNNSPKQDPDNPLGFEPFSNTPKAVYLRDSNFQNIECMAPKEISFYQNPLDNNAESFFNNYYYNSTLSNLLSTKTTTAFGSDFYSNLHKGALWFKGKTEGKTQFILDISKQNDAEGDDEVNIGNNKNVRISIFKSCSATSAIYSSIVDLSLGGIFLLEKSGSSLKIKDSAGVEQTLASGTWFSSGEYFIAIDTPLKQVNIFQEQSLVQEQIYFVSPTDGCYSISKRDVELSRVDIQWSEIRLKKVCTYVALCEFEQPIAQSCKAIPYKKGSFSYWESTEKYPDNPELFDSSSLKINPERLDNLLPGIKEEFENIYTNGVSNGAYIFKEEIYDGYSKKVSDFTCRNIRHFKFPDNNIAPFMYNNPQSRFGQTVIFPLGITIDETVINAFLDIAVDNNLISKSDRDKIVGYEIFRGDISLDRSVVASGLLYDMRKYREDPSIDKDILYSNYPYNSYSIDKFNRPFTEVGETDATRTNLGEGAIFGESNRHYTFHSPETDYSRVGLPSEVSFQGYQFGNSRGNFDQVKDHPKWVILSDKAYSLASTLATVEVIAEGAIAAAQALSNGQIWAIGGFANGVSLGALAYTASAIITGFSTLTAAVFKYGRYRYEWLKIFRDLGTPHNFAYYYFSEGYYNYMSKIPLPQNGKWVDEKNKIRSANIAKYLSDGRYILTNETTGEKLNVNNIDRENSVFLSFGKYPIEYPSIVSYVNYDKSTNDSSITYLGENGFSTSGRSPEIIRNVASPYVALKNYIASQYGTISSVKWLSTGYRGDLKNPQTGCVSIFGGDTFITRHTLKRKMSQFLVTAMKQADLTPYNYYFYNNIGRRPNFYVSYEENKDFNGRGKLFPDIRSDFNFDTPTTGGNYYKPPSKFYLYHYGVPNFLTETRINTSYRYSGKERREGFYPLVGDLGEWTQEINVPIREPNIFKYNPTYSNQVSRNRSRTIPDNYQKRLYDAIESMPNGIIASLPDNSETSSYDPWLIYRPLDTFEFPSNYGKLRDVIDVESGAILARFNDTSVLYNKVDTKIDTGSAITATTLGGNMFFQRASTSFVNAKLGYGGTQNFAQISCEGGHFWVDAKRGQVLMLPPNGGGISEISTGYGNKPSGMRNWFKEHLPFKILKTLPNVDIDNPYNGVGITMGWDSRYRRVLITKKDYIPKPCVQFIPGQGFVYNETLCGEEPIVTCPEGYVFNSYGQCVLEYTTNNLCPDGYSYVYNQNNPSESYCEAVEEYPADCVCTADVIATPQTICSGETSSINLTSTVPGVVFSWVVSQSGVNGATAGSGSSISQTLIATGTTAGTAVYTITPYEPGVNGCAGQSIQVTVTVNPTPNVIAIPSSLNILDGDTFSIDLTSDFQGTTFTWTALNQGVTGGLPGSGNNISGTATGSGTITFIVTPTLGNCQGQPIDVVVTVGAQVITNNTKINIWFDNSGSMNSTLAPLQTMASTILKDCLLPAYNNDSALYDSRVEVLNFSTPANPIASERYIRLLATTSSDPNITKVINLTFADESNTYGAETTYQGVITTTAQEDIALLRNNINNNPTNYLVGVGFQVATGGVNTPQYPGFRTFVNNVHTGIAPFTGTNGLSDKPEIGYQLDVLPGSTPQYYVNLIINALNSLGFSLSPCQSAP